MRHLPASSKGTRSPAREGRCRTSLNWSSPPLMIVEVKVAPEPPIWLKIAGTDSIIQVQRVERRGGMTDLLRIDEDGVALNLLIRGFQVSRMIRLVADLGLPTDRAADVRPTLGGDQRRNIVSDCFGERPHSSARCPIAAVVKACATPALARRRSRALTAGGQVLHKPRGRKPRRPPRWSLGAAAMAIELR